MVMYMSLDKDNFITGWSSSPMEGFIEVEYDKVSDNVKQTLGLYRYENNTFIYDDSNVVKSLRSNKMSELTGDARENDNHGFLVLVGDEKVRFENTESNKSFLQKSYTMYDRGMIKATTMKFLTAEGVETAREVRGIQIEEIWGLSFIHEDEINRKLEELSIKVKNAETMEEITAIKWEKVD